MIPSERTLEQIKSQAVTKKMKNLLFFEGCSADLVHIKIELIEKFEQKNCWDLVFPLPDMALDPIA
jgi:hypothetical protein